MKKALCFFAIIVAIVVTSVIYGCYTDKRQYNESLEQRLELGKQNACAGMKLKYGIDVEVVDAYVDERAFAYDYGWVWVTVNDGEKDFHVRTGGTVENARCDDDYQAEEISNALFDMVKADIPTAFEYEFYDDKMRYRRYDGDNLDEIFLEQGKLYVYCVNADFEEVPVFDFLRNHIRQCNLYSFSSEEMLNDFIEHNSWGIERYAPFIDSYCVVDDSESDCKIETYNIQKYNDFMYYLPYAKTDVKSEIIFEEIPESSFDWTDNEYEFITAYGLKENCNVNIWFPIPDDKKDKEFYWAVEFYDYENKKIQETKKCRIIDGYVVCNFLSYFEDVKFALLCK